MKIKGCIPDASDKTLDEFDYLLSKAIYLSEKLISKPNIDVIVRVAVSFAFNFTTEYYMTCPGPLKFKNFYLFVRFLMEEKRFPRKIVFFRLFIAITLNA